MEDYQDRLAIATPEGVHVDLVLAGVGSRAGAAVLDLLIQAGLVLALLVLVGVVGGLEALVVLVVAIPLVSLLYDVLFEVLGSGRTPGKRANGLRVVRADGRPVDLLSSLIRNVVRLLEGVGLLYAPAIVSVLVTRRNQRLGDLAASTLVVRDAVVAEAVVLPASVPHSAAGPLDVTQVTPQDLAALRSFLGRRGSLDARLRTELAGRLATAVAPRVGGGTEGLGAEELIARVVAAKDAATR